MNKVKILRVILLVLIIFWTGLIFLFSSQDGGESSGISRKFVELFTKDPEVIDIVEPYVRKLAHFSEYGLGGVLFISLFSTYEWTDRKKITVSILLGVWYAVMDEIHQLMVPGRSGALKDVYIDSLGIATGVIGMMIIIKIYELIRFKKKNTNKLKV